MRRDLLCLLSLGAALASGCTRDRTQVMLGVITNLFAPGELSQVRLTISRNQVPVQDRRWTIPGTLKGDYQLPGSVGIYSEDNSAIDITVTLSGFRGPDNDPLRGAPMTEIVRRESQFTLVPGQTLFTRMALALNCVASLDTGAPKGCAAGQTCVEGRCVQALTDARRFPAYEQGMERSVQCRSGREGRDYHDTETADPGLPLDRRPKLPVRGSGQCAAGEECIEGTCYKPGAAPLDMNAAPTPDQGDDPRGPDLWSLPPGADLSGNLPLSDLASNLPSSDFAGNLPLADLGANLPLSDLPPPPSDLILIRDDAGKQTLAVPPR